MGSDSLPDMTQGPELPRILTDEPVGEVDASQADEPVGEVAPTEADEPAPDRPQVDDQRTPGPWMGVTADGAIALLTWLVGTPLAVLLVHRLDLDPFSVAGVVMSVAVGALVGPWSCTRPGLLLGQAHRTRHGGVCRLDRAHAGHGPSRDALRLWGARRRRGTFRRHGHEVHVDLAVRGLVRPGPADRFHPCTPGSSAMWRRWSTGPRGSSSARRRSWSCQALSSWPT